MSGLNLAEFIEEGSMMLQDENANPGASGASNFLDNFVMMPEKEGILTVRLLPPAEGAKFCQATRIHTINGRKIHCRRDWVKGKKYPIGDCSICEHYNWLYRQKDIALSKGDKAAADEFVREARTLKPVERYYFNAIVRKVVKPDGTVELNVGPKILSVGKTLFQKIFQAIKGIEQVINGEVYRKSPLGDVSDPVNGRDFQIWKKMVKGDDEEYYPRYDSSEFQGVSPLGNPDQIKMWLASLHDLASLRQVKTADEVKHEMKIYLGFVSNERKGSTYDPKQLMEDGDINCQSSKSPVVPKTVSEPGFDDPNDGFLIPSAPVIEKTAPVVDVSLDSESFINALKSL